MIYIKFLFVFWECVAYKDVNVLRVIRGRFIFVISITGIFDFWVVVFSVLYFSDLSFVSVFLLQV